MGILRLEERYYLDLLDTAEMIPLFHLNATKAPLCCPDLKLLLQ